MQTSNDDPGKDKKSLLRAVGQACLASQPHKNMKSQSTVLTPRRTGCGRMFEDLMKSAGAD
jgi:hypothetical protein